MVDGLGWGESGATTDGDLREFLDLSNDLFAVSSRDGVFCASTGC